MPRHHYSNRAILILENPWELDEGDCNRTSVLPFVEGIAKLAGDTEVFHANFYDKRSFDRALEILCSARFNNAVIYIAAHGNKGKVGGVKLRSLQEHEHHRHHAGILLRRHGHRHNRGLYAGHKYQVVCRLLVQLRLAPCHDDRLLDHGLNA